MATEALGAQRLTVLDVVGQRLSRRPIAAVVRGYEAPRVLDVGCGHHAGLLVELAPKILRGVGVDRSISADAKRHANLEFFEGEAQPALRSLVELAAEDSFAAARFDVVCLCSVLEHLTAPEEMLALCHALLARRGSLIVNVPTWAGKVALETAAFRLGLSNVASIDDHKMYYSKRDLWPLLVRAGFRPRAIRLRYHKLGLNLFAVAEKG